MEELQKRNKEIAKTIINLFAEKKCTVDESVRLLSWVSRELQKHSTVQKIENDS